MKKTKCIMCGETKNLTIHHKTPKSQGGLDNKENKMTLCLKCHNFVHKKGSHTKNLRILKKRLAKDVKNN